MKRLFTTICATIFTFAAIGLVFAASNDGYSDGDIMTNPWDDLFTTEAVEETTTEEVTSQEETIEEETTKEEPTTEEPTTEETTVEETTVEEATTEEETSADKQEFAIKTQPQDVTVNSGDAVVISVVATGEGLTYCWEISKDGGDTWTPSTVDGYNSSTISFTAIENQHGRLYRCIITNEENKTLISDAATIYIEQLVDQVVIISQPKDVTADANSKESMSVAAVGKNLSYQWEMSKDGGTTWTKSTVDGYNSAKITFTAIESLHGRTYRCVVSDLNGNTVESDGATVIINELKNDLMIIAQPQNKTVAVEDKTIMSVGATGVGLNYQWQLSKDGGTTWTNSNIDGYNTSAITFNPLETFHGRQYRCVVTDVNGNVVTSNGATLLIDTLADQLMIVGQPQSRTVPSGSLTKIAVGATGNGLKYQWEFSKDGGITWTNTSVDGYNTSALIFKPNDNFNGRMYRCVVTDENGDTITSNDAALIMEDLQDQLMVITQPKDVSVSAGESVTISIRATGKNVTYQWQLSKDGGTTWTNSNIDGYNTSTISFKPTTMFDGRMYRCVITDQDGNSVATLGSLVTVK